VQCKEGKSVFGHGEPIRQRIWTSGSQMGIRVPLELRN